ncbi:MAG: S-layer homology domain-containing protein [Chloroflexota bacterium]
MLRKSFILAVGLLALLALGGVASAQSTSKDSKATIPDVCVFPFTDVPDGSTFRPFIECLFCRNIIGGYPDNTFRPNNNVTRGQLSKIVSESAGFNGPAGLQIFEDVPPGSTYYDYINRLVQFGYINGYDCGGPGEPCSPAGYRYFRPNAPATRGQIAKIVTQAAGWNEPPGDQIFEDVPPAHTFYPYIQRLSLHNAVTGYPCGGPGEPCGNGNMPYYRADNLTTRGQLSKIDVYAFFSICIP